MSKKIKNFTFENFINHKNDKIFKEYKCENSNLYIYITKMYKIVKIDTKDIIYIIYLNNFFEIIISSYLRNNFSIFSDNSKKIKIKKNKKNFFVLYNEDNLFDFTYLKSKIIINEIKHLYKSNIINSIYFCHIENKKNELNIIFKQFDNYLNKNTNKLFLILKNKNFINNINTSIKLSKIICIKLIYLYYSYQMK